MSLHITNFAHLVNSTKEQNKPEVTMSVSQANLLLTDIIDLQSKLIGTQEQLIKALEQNNAPTTGSMDAGSFKS
tara:strand:- start:4508 stop:4729 length:222 start_codon:yes stop_codon:yes gene_type:complete